MANEAETNSPTLRRLAIKFAAFVAAILLILVWVGVYSNSRIKAETAQRLSETIREPLIQGDMRSVILQLSRPVAAEFHSVVWTPEGGGEAITVPPGASAPSGLIFSRARVRVYFDEAGHATAGVLEFRFNRWAGLRLALVAWLVLALVALPAAMQERRRLQHEYATGLVRQAERAYADAAAQVAHDIAAPLASLRSLIGRLGGIPAEERSLASTIADRIAEITDDLDRRRKRDQGVVGVTGLEFVAPIVRSIVSEKRMAIPEGVELRTSVAVGADCLARISKKEFRRLLSNIIDNAVQAVGSSGVVVVSVTMFAAGVEIFVKDDGGGIAPAVLARLGQKGATFGKPDGTGLGLWHAMTTVESWGGRLEIESALGKGTTVRLLLPRAETPAWVCPELVLRPGQTGVVLDDEDSIHALWDKRLAEAGAKVLHARTPEEFRALAAPPDALYLLDHQLAGRPETGLSLAQERGVAARAVLVTGRHDDPALQAECLRRGVRIVPKELAGHVPIRVAGPAATPDAVLIDDDPLVRMNWSLAAKRAGKALSAFGDAASFIREADGLPKQVPIYVDSHLGDGLKGEDAALDFSRRGFTELHLETGHDPASFGPLAHIRSVRGKEPPWPAA